MKSLACVLFATVIAGGCESSSKLDGTVGGGGGDLEARVKKLEEENAKYHEALEFLHGGGDPRLILLDLMMPEMNGWQFREEQLRDDRLKGIPVVVKTASRGLEANPIAADEVQLNPLGLGELVEAIARNVR